MFNQLVGMTLILLMMSWGMSFFLRSRCVMDFYAWGLRSITYGLHRDPGRIPERMPVEVATGWCGHPLRIEIPLHGSGGGLVGVSGRP